MGILTSQSEDASFRSTDIRFRTLFETANDAILIMDGEKFVECNASAIDMFGCRHKSDIVGHTPVELSPAKQPDGMASEDKALAYIHACLNSEPQSFYWKHCRKDRSLFDAEVALNSVDLNGTVYIQAIVRDITERMRMQEALRSSEKKFRSMFETHSAVMLLVDPATGRIIDANRAAQHFYGYSSSELLSMSIHNINTLQQDELKIVYKLALQMSRNNFVFTHRLASGEFRTVEVHSSPIEHKGQILLFSIIHDITGSKMAEEALESTNAYQIGRASCRERV